MTPRAQRRTRAGAEEGLQAGLRNRWWPVFESKDLRGVPVAIRRLGEDLVLWRDGKGAGHLFIDRCPHRGAALSKGFVRGTELQCWYHGFRYDGSGQCTAVPAEGLESALPNRVSITSYPVAERAGLIWAYIGETDLFPTPPLTLPEELGSEDWPFFISRATWEANWLLAFDNLMDPMHGSYLHASSYTLRYGSKEDRMRIRDLDDGFIVEREQQRGVNFDWTEFHDSGSLWVRLDIPYPKTAGPGGPFRILGWATPIDASQTLVYFLRLRHVSGWKRALWRLMYRWRLEDNHWLVLEQDRAILESQRGLSSRLWEHMSQTDVGVIRLRRRLNELYWKQRETYLAAAAAGRKPTAGERARTILAQSAEAWAAT
ncbi:MAG: aromatic ring-hydroxylating dioxygenase subunit alpha [Chloroflexi bacterium]|nr:aromatic ring-hydroxylating dioxygenase subunit alpha [Chloroflexota bacterium]